MQLPGSLPHCVWPHRHAVMSAGVMSSLVAGSLAVWMQPWNSTDDLRRVPEVVKVSRVETASEFESWLFALRPDEAGKQRRSM